MSHEDRNLPDPPQLAAESLPADAGTAAHSIDPHSSSRDSSATRRVDDSAELASRIAASDDATINSVSARTSEMAPSGSSADARATRGSTSASDQRLPTRRRRGWLAAVAGLIARSPLAALCRTLGRTVRRTVARESVLSVALSRSVGGALSVSRSAAWFAVRVVAIKALRRPLCAAGPPLLWPALHVVAAVHLGERIKGKAGGRVGGGGTVVAEGRGEAAAHLEGIGGAEELLSGVVAVTRGGTWMILEVFSAPLLAATLSSLLPILFPRRSSPHRPPKRASPMRSPSAETLHTTPATAAAAAAAAELTAVEAGAWPSGVGATGAAGATALTDSPLASLSAATAPTLPSLPPPFPTAVIPALPSPPSPTLSPGDRDLIRDVRLALLDADVDTHEWLSDDSILRYAVSGKRHVPRIVKGITATAEWRRSFRLMPPSEVCCSPFGEYGYWHGVDVDCRPCLVLHVGRAAKAIPSALHSDFVRYLASLVSAVAAALTLSSPDSGRIAVVLDCQGAPSLWHLPVALLRATITALHRNFPHRMARLHVLHLPPALRLLARAMLQLLSPATRSKIQVMGGGSAATSALCDLFGAQVSVPARLAGGCTCGVCCEREGEAEESRGSWVQQRHRGTHGETVAATQAGGAAEGAAGAGAARDASVSGLSDSPSLDHPGNSVTHPSARLPSPVAPCTPQQRSPQQPSSHHPSPLHPRLRSPIPSAALTGRGAPPLQGVEWAEMRWVSRHVALRLLLLLMTLTLAALCLCSAAALAGYSVPHAVCA
ncbi:hypothetical protein CLOM_g13754 [Closterium sp. NIES-68]|nr:hypothetical protein CLOM_g13754 [Closterium sp. NIES-68]GJP63646.1 hypothetical protein CLOP_g20712 [Closterium sp. NIES-67]GJP69437.1 hypothetical protein CLOP_g430 [Closterium sp. NIES-67]